MTNGKQEGVNYFCSIANKFSVERDTQKTREL